MKTAVLGVTGYTGQILLRLLSEHPEVECIIPSSSSKFGESLKTLDPGLSDTLFSKTEITGGKMVSLEDCAALKPDAVFAPLPHLASAKTCAPFFGKTVVIDLSADLRLPDTDKFFKAYGEAPPRPDLLSQAVYGLCEINRDQIAGADIIANPGCYPTATLLPLIPLLKRKAITGIIVVNALSGISGAGKKAQENLLFCERTENTGAYYPGKTHRHVTEIESQICIYSDNTDLFFTPHLVPIKRGMAVTTTVHLSRDIPEEEIRDYFRQDYQETPFVQFREDSIPQTRDVWGSNSCHISLRKAGRVLMLFSVIDNLVKGASGQAVQNMNIRFRLRETAGLRTYGEL